MASEEDNENPPSSAFDWDIYAQYRPPYPPSLTKLILDYHRAHSNSLRLAHDIGSGSGIFAQTLSEFFQHVHVSDPNASNIAHARERLGEWYKRNWWKAKFTFSVTRAEEACEATVEGSVDLCTLMMCAHWCEGEAMVESVARSLGANGTLAVVQYNPAPRVVGNEKVAEAVRKLYATWGRMVVERVRPHGRGLIERNNSPLDWIGLPEGLFIQDVTKRIKINAYGKGNEMFLIPGQEGLVALSRVGEEQRKYWFDEGNAEAEGWRMEVEAEWFRGNLLSMQQKDVIDVHEEDLTEVERMIRETTENGRVVVEWSVAVLLATRK